MEKKKVIRSFDALPAEVIEAIKLQYPEGYANHVKKITTPLSTFWAITVDTPEVVYLVKVPVKIDNKPPTLDTDLIIESTSTKGIEEEEEKEEENDNADE